MNKKGQILAVLILAATLVLASCSAEEKTEPEERGAIKEMTDKTAHEMVERMTTPLDQARSATARQEEQNQALEQADRQD